MRYYLDTEFIEDGKTIDLVSLAIVAEDGREFYTEVDGVDWSKASEWVLNNVRPALWHRAGDKSRGNRWSRDGGTGGLMTRDLVGSSILRWLGEDEHPEFWAYFGDYDWVVLCQLYGSMSDLPAGWPMYCRDLKQEWERLPMVPRQTMVGTIHHALEDARWTKLQHEAILRFETSTPIIED